MIPEVPKRWPGETFVLIGGGPSLTQADVEAVHDATYSGPHGLEAHLYKPWTKLRVVAINDAFKLASWADCLYACDRKWIDWHDGVPSFTGPKYSLASSDPTPRPDWTVLQNTGTTGLELDPTGLRTGINSGYQAINLAVHLGASRIILLGYDMGPDGTRDHWFGEHPDGQPSPYPQMREYFETLVEPLQAIGVTVINCSRRTALTAFPCVPLEQELARLQERAA